MVYIFFYVILYDDALRLKHVTTLKDITHNSCAKGILFLLISFKFKASMSKVLLFSLQQYLMTPTIVCSMLDLQFIIFYDRWNTVMQTEVIIFPCENQALPTFLTIFKLWIYYAD
jgi:hypothetical protein